MTDEEGRSIALPLDFLGAGRYRATAWTDAGAPAALDVRSWTVGKGERQPVSLRLAPTGGAALRFKAD